MIGIDVLSILLVGGVDGHAPQQAPQGHGIVEEDR
jgi:hypothetical protein